jgi:pimeloyl-ACP methyl ester carboxylesterase
MYFTASRGNRIYFETFGPAGGVPVLLIHGSTMDGRQDFVIESNLAARLATDCRVIVPDCPGHGRSDPVWHDTAQAHPGGPLEYSFSAMARDFAGLLTALEATPAVVMGHSNGGNVALFMLKEHTALCRGGVLLAANGYIDAHLPASVPRSMNPQRVARERVAWMREMQVLHDAHHGPGYWQLLLRATIHETITTPNWSAADLAHVQAPVLCVQGGNDSVNVPGRHAQTLADWLPNATAWVPEGIGHSVHHELPDEFERRMRAVIAGA